jgi:WD40 repeat protein
VKRQSERAKAQVELAQQHLYDVRMGLLQRFWEEYDVGFLQQGLAEQLPANQDSIDRRGFEWFYWQRKTSCIVTIKTNFRNVKFSPDSERFASRGNGIIKLWDAVTGQETLTLTLK